MRASGNWTWPSLSGSSCSTAQRWISSGVRSGRPSLSDLPRLRSCRNCWYSRFSSWSRSDAADEGAVLAQAFGILEVGAIDLRVVRQLARPVHGESGVARASDAGVELLPALRLLRSAALVVNVAPVVELLLHGRPSQFFAVHVGPAVALEDVASALGQHDQRAVVADGRNGLDEPRVSEVPEIAPVRIERTVLAVAEIAGRHDAEGADRGQRANLRAAQPHVAVSRPDTLAFRAARQLEVAREHIARIERLALARIGQPAAAALAELRDRSRRGRVSHHSNEDRSP